MWAVTVANPHKVVKSTIANATLISASLPSTVLAAMVVNDAVGLIPSGRLNKMARMLIDRMKEVVIPAGQAVLTVRKTTFTDIANGIYNKNAVSSSVSNTGTVLSAVSTANAMACFVNTPNVPDLLPAINGLWLCLVKAKNGRWTLADSVTPP
jgi:hypothetical protein